MTTRGWAAPLLLAVATLALYAWRLGAAPIYPSPDEMTIGVGAHALATTGRDLDGNRLPLYFHVDQGESREGWFTPVIFYSIALALKAMPISVTAIRLPTVFVGIADVVLMYFLARRLFGSPALATIAAALLALTPAHMMLSRYALDYLYPLPFLLAWLLCLAEYDARPRPAVLVCGMAALGFGFYSYIASVVMMPLYALMTAFVLWWKKSPPSRYALAAAGFFIPLLPFVVWFSAHPSAFADTAARYDLYQPGRLGVLHAARLLVSFLRLDDAASRYWSFFSPSFLFISGDSHMMFSTRLAGVFLVPIAALLAVGIRESLVPRYRFAPILLAGFVTAPLAALLVPEPSAINRAVALMPFGILLATLGASALWAARNRFGRVLVVGLLALVPLQFAMFARDYFGPYRLRSAYWLGGNLPGALDYLAARAHDSQAPAVYFATLRSTAGLVDIRNRWMPWYWKFCLAVHGTEDLLARTKTFDGSGIDRMPRGSLVLGNVGESTVEGLTRAGQFKPIAQIPEADHSTFFVVFER